MRKWFTRDQVGTGRPTPRIKDSWEREGIGVSSCLAGKPSRFVREGRWQRRLCKLFYSNTLKKVAKERAASSRLQKSLGDAE